MNNIGELKELTLELLEGTATEKNPGTSSTFGSETIQFTNRCREIIDEISDYAEQTDVFKDHEEEGKLFFDGATAAEIFRHMLNRIANAPTSIHVNVSIILIMPFLRRKLREDEAKSQDDVAQN